MAGILGLVAVLGIAWLVSVAAGGNREQLAGQNAPAGTSDVPAGSTGSDGSAEEPPGQATDGTEGQPQTPGGGASSPRARNNRRSINWNGVHLDGSPGDNGCVTIINKTSTVGVIESVSFTVVSGPGSATARTDAGHCDSTGDPLCQGIQMRAGSQCLAGTVLTGDASDQPYVVQATVHFRYVCVNVTDSPCDEVGDWGGPPPTEESPVEVRGTTDNNVPQADAFVGGPASPDEESPPPATGESGGDNGTPAAQPGTPADSASTAPETE
jgi:hypothetical protein